MMPLSSFDPTTTNLPLSVRKNMFLYSSLKLRTIQCELLSFTLTGLECEHLSQPIIQCELLSFPLTGLECEHLSQLCHRQVSDVRPISVIPLHLRQLCQDPGGVPQAEGAQRPGQQQHLDGENAPSSPAPDPLSTPPQGSTEPAHSQCLCEYHSVWLLYCHVVLVISFLLSSMPMIFKFIFILIFYLLMIFDIYFLFCLSWFFSEFTVP